MKIILPAALALLAASTAMAGDGSGRYLTLTSENDLYTNSGDAYYTNGARIAYGDEKFLPPPPMRWVAEQIPFLFDPNQPTLVQYSLGQSLYTPKDITVRGPQPNDRPWAAFLYGSVGMSQVKDDAVNELELTLGMVGPAAQGEFTQKTIHHLVDARNPQGWDNQLKDEPILNLGFQRRWPTFWTHPVGTATLGLMPHVGAAVGNARDHLAAGATLRLSSQPVADNPLRVAPAVPGTGYFKSEDKINWTLFTGVEGRAVAHDIFLDGNTFQDSARIDKKPLVADLQAGAMLTYRDYQLGYTAVYRTQEFYGQKNGQIFGAISLGKKF